jgi:hypothetical protein
MVFRIFSMQDICINQRKNGQVKKYTCTHLDWRQRKEHSAQDGYTGGTGRTMVLNTSTRLHSISLLENGRSLNNA